MKTLLLFSSFLLSITSTLAQQVTFERVLPLSPQPQNIADIIGVFNGSADLSDVDNDGDLDLLLTGQKSTPAGDATLLYKNNGMGDFTVAIAPALVSVSKSAIKFCDTDNDGDDDILITGSYSGQPITAYYKNDGLGNFTYQAGSPFTNIHSGAIAFGDVNADGYKDVIISGRTAANTNVSELYMNDGNGNYSLQSGPFTGVYNSAVSFADVDGDNDADLLVSGETDITISTELYLNDGTGNFTVDVTAGIEALTYSAIAFGDLDGDLDQDLIVCGLGSSSNTTRYYKNDGTGNFQLISNVFENIAFGEIDLNDVDADGDLDVLISGSGFDHTIKLYLNNGNGNFSLYNGNDFGGLSYTTQVFGDVDGDGDDDFVIAGGGSHYMSQLYMNQGSANFKIASGSAFRGYGTSTLDCGDVDGDGDQDVLLSGWRPGNWDTQLYTNDGDGNFIENLSINFPNIYSGEVELLDMQMDGDLDIILISSTNSTIIQNNAGVFNAIANSMPPLDLSNVNGDVSDVDGDGDQDILIAGDGNNFALHTYLLLNNGSFFSIQGGQPFIDVTSASIAFADIDNDNDQDAYVAGWNQGETANFYLNDGTGNFTLANNVTITPNQSGSADFADIDNDDDQDLLISGSAASGYISELYLNDGSGNFILQNGTSFEGLVYSTIKFADVEEDGDADVLITGADITAVPKSNLYINEGNGTFNLLNSSEFNGVFLSDAQFFDIDGDTDKDLIISGQSFNDDMTLLYRNTTCINDTIIQGTFTMTSTTACSGIMVLSIGGVGTFVSAIDGGNQFGHSGSHTIQGLCPGVHWIETFDGCNTLSTAPFVVSIDSNYFFINPFIDSIAVDSLGKTNQSCTIDYSQIDTAYIDSLWATGNTANVVWKTISSLGIHRDTSAYALNRGNGVYWLQLGLFCPQNPTNDYFTVTEAIYFEDGTVTMAGLNDPELFAVNLFPNPSDGWVTVITDEREAFLSVIDAQGKLVHSKTPLNGQTTVDLSHVESGIYFFRLETEKGCVVKRVVKR